MPTLIKLNSGTTSSVGIDIYDLDDDIVISLIEKPGSNAFITKDAVGRILFNCVVLGTAVRDHRRDKSIPRGEKAVRSE